MGTLLTLISSRTVDMGVRKRTSQPRKNTKTRQQKATDLVQFIPLSFCRPSELRLLGPTCKKMNDLSADKIFKSAAFEPSDEELSNHARSKRREKKGKSSRSEVRLRSPSPLKSFEDFMISDSDDDLPDVASMFEDRPKKRQKKNMKSAPDDVGDFLAPTCAPLIIRVGRDG